MKSIIVSLSFLFLPFVLFSQKQQINCAEELLVSQTVSEINYTLYPDSLVITKYNAFAEVSNKSPEELMKSVLSASSLDWMNFNKEEKIANSSQDFNFIKNSVDSSYYFVVEAKIEFAANNLYYAIVKYRLYENTKVYGFAEGMVKIEDRWYTTKKSEINQLLFFMGMVDLYYIEAIFKQYQTENKQFNQIREQFSESGSINLTGLLSALEESLSRNELIGILDPNRIFK